MVPEELLKVLNHHRSQCYWPVVTETGHGLFFGQRDYDGGHHEGWDGGVPLGPADFRRLTAHNMVKHGFT